VNGVQFAATSNMTHQQLINDMNARSADTGVTVAIAGGNYVFTAVNYGTGGDNIVVTNDTANLGFAAAGSRNLASGANTVASITDGTNTWTTASGAITVDATDGRTLRDAYGNVIKLSNNGAQTTGASTISISAGTAQFQVGANVGQTVSLSLSNMGASALGIGALDITTSAGANSAMNLIDTAINTVGQVRGNIGNFQRNVLESNTRALSVARENITSTESSIRDTDIAEEMTMYTKLQILQQSGLSVLAQANQAPQAVLSLLRG
jgi:flagellin